MLDKLEEFGLAESSLVMFSGDNGPHAEGGNDPEFFNSNGLLRGIKRDLYEGGIRVPTIAWGPGFVPSGVVSEHDGYFGDLMATFAELAGAGLPPGRDSLSFAATLRGQPKEQDAHDFLYWEFYTQGSSQAVRMGNWKAVRSPMTTGLIELYDLSSDIGESTDLADQHPAIVTRAADFMDASHHPSPHWVPDSPSE